MARIMVVDDDAKLRWIITAILEREGHQMIVSESGYKCLEILGAGERPDLILLDVMMPGLDGWQTCKKIKENEETKDLVVVMLTVRDKVEDKLKSLEKASADWHISKPMEKAKFVETVKWLLSLPQGKNEIVKVLELSSVDFSS